MTTLRRRYRRVSSAAVFSRGRYRPVVVILEPPGTLLGLRLKGERRTYHLPLAWCYTEAVRRTVAVERDAKWKAKVALEQSAKRKARKERRP